ncbi:MAG: hypothetical protein ACTSPK_01065 [Candidatus Heimdallarchaeota archaeon]
MKLKSEHFIILTLIFPVIGVIIWFILDTVNVEIAKEVAILVTIILYSGLIASALHGKGILPSPSKVRFRVKNGLPKYRRKIFLKTKAYERISHKKGPYVRSPYRSKNK